MSPGTFSPAPGGASLSRMVLAQSRMEARLLLRNGEQLLLAIVITCAGVAAGAWWELLEWGYDYIVPGDAIKGKHDTMLDLVMDTGGALLASWMSLRVLRPARGGGGGV